MQWMVMIRQWDWFLIISNTSMLNVTMIEREKSWLLPRIDPIRSGLWLILTHILGPRPRKPLEMSFRCSFDLHKPTETFFPLDPPYSRKNFSRSKLKEFKIYEMLIKHKAFSSEHTLYLLKRLSWSNALRKIITGIFVWIAKPFYLHRLFRSTTRKSNDSNVEESVQKEHRNGTSRVVMLKQ